MYGTSYHFLNMHFIFLVLVTGWDQFILPGMSFFPPLPFPTIESLFIFKCPIKVLGFPGGSAVKNWPANTLDEGSIPGSGRSPGGRNGHPLQYSCLKNPMDRGPQPAALHGVTKSQTQFSH